MRAKEFVVNVPVAVTTDGKTVKFRVLNFDASNVQEPTADVDSDGEQNAYMSPQQQELELKKAALGKQSPAGNQLLDDAEDGEVA